MALVLVSDLLSDRAGQATKSDIGIETNTPVARYPENEDEWNARRQLITRLVADEDHSLPRVIEILREEHGLKVTKSMLINRIKKWHLDNKYINEGTALAVVRKKRERDAVGKDSVFRLNGRVKQANDCERHLKRKGWTTEDIAAKILERPLTPEGLRCFTPEPMDRLIPLRDLDVADRLLRSVRNYVRTNFDVGTPHLLEIELFQPGCSLREARGINNHLIISIELLNMGYMRQSFERLQWVSNYLSRGLARWCCDAIRSLFNSCYIIAIAAPEYTLPLLDQISSGLDRRELQQLDPLLQACRSAFTRTNEAYLGIISEAWRCVNTTVDEWKGYCSEHSQFRWLDFYTTTLNSLDVALEAKITSIMKRSSIISWHQAPILFMLLDFATILSFQGRIDEMQAVVNHVVRTVSNTDLVWRAEIEARCHHFLSNAERDRGNVGSQELLLFKALELAESAHGTSSNMFIYYRMQLEEFMQSVGDMQTMSAVRYITKSLMFEAESAIPSKMPRPACNFRLTAEVE